ncbi:MAG: surface lipoprotein assembly modifier [Pseudooceanicola sp.]
MALPLWAGPLHAERVRLNPDEMRLSAVEMLDQRRPDVAAAMTDALLKRDPNDVQALLIRSRAMRDLGRLDEAREAARRALALAGSDRTVVHAASLAMAQAHSSQGRRTIAQLWLRRAAQNAPDAAARDQAERDFRYVRSRNRWSTQLSFSVAPKSNINNGSVHASVQLHGLPFDTPLPGAAQALSGIELTFTGTTRYRIAETRTRATDLTFSAARQNYILSDSAKQKAPGSKGSDFAITTASAGIAHKALFDQNRGEYTMSANAGGFFLGNNHYGNFVRGSVGARYAVSARTKVNIGLQGDVTSGPRAPHAKAAKLHGGVTHSFDSGMQIGVTFDLTQSWSDIDVADYRQLRLGLNIASPKPILGAQTRVGLGWRIRDFERSKYAPGKGRRDTEWTAYVDMRFTNIDYYGFNPTLTVNASRQNSSVDLFDINRFGVQLGIRSAF